MTDQQRGDCLGIEGHPCLVTPSMDHIAAEGTRFHRAYSTCPSCVAARRSLLSGQFPTTHGLVGYADALEWDAPPTLPGVLSDAGYQSYLVGRDMHQSPRRKRYGYDHMVTATPGGAYDRFLSRNAPEAGGYFGGGVMHNDFTARPWHLPDNTHMTTWVTEQALEFTEERDPSVPFFLTVSYAAPHPPLQPPAFYMDRYLRADLPDPVIGDWAQMPPNEGLGVDPASMRVNLTGEMLKSAQAAYYGMINHVDDQIRRLLNQITGGTYDLRNTIVVFTSDHGEMLGDHHLFRKQWSYEGSARIPMLIQPPEHLGYDKSCVSEAPVCLEDVMPTLLDMVGVDIPDTVEGRSMAPLMRGEESGWRDYLHIEHAPYQQTVTDGREKFIWLPDTGCEQFFDLTKDPDELHNLIDTPEYQTLVSEWRGRLINELSDRPEGFVEDGNLIPGREYPSALPHAGTPDHTFAGWGRR
jgi:arylsulfatase